MLPEYFLARMKAQWDEAGGRILLGYKKGGEAFMLLSIGFQLVGS
jgi:hypothetical protein